MFCSDKLKNNVILRSAWHAAYKFKPPSTYNTPQPKTCEDQDVCVKSNRKNPNKHLSSRPSATLIARKAKLYKQRVHTIFEDVKKLSKELRECSSRKHKERNESTVASSETTANKQSTSSSEIIVEDDDENNSELDAFSMRNWRGSNATLSDLTNNEPEFPEGDPNGFVTI